MSVSPDAERSARLLFWPELSSWAVSGEDLRRSEILRLCVARRVPPLPLRYAQRLAMKAGRLSYERQWLDRLVAARARLIGAGAAAPPRFLLRADEYPNQSLGIASERRGQEIAETFHGILHEAGVAYLTAVTPQLSDDVLNPSAGGWRPLTPEEIAFLARLRSDGVELALHGLTHRTRSANPRMRSELCGLDAATLTALLDEGLARLQAAVDARPEVFVAPFNRFDARQYGVLASRFRVITGGPESVALMGFHGSPLWRGRAVYMPCYAPFYAPAAELEPHVRRLIAAGVGTWVPLTLHPAWEQRDGFAGLRRLARTLAPHAVPWSEFALAVHGSAWP